MRSRTLVWMIGAMSLVAGCSGNQVKPVDVLDPSSGESIADCKRRTRAAAQQEESMRRVDQPGKFRGWQDEPRDGSTQADPCRKDPGPGGLGTADKGVEAQQRQFAKTRARVMLQSKEPVAARDALVGAFGAPAPPDAEVAPLAESVTAAYQAERVARFNKSGHIGKLDDGAPTCAFARFPINDAGESSLNQVRYLFRADEQIHALCRLPDRGISGAQGDVKLTVWHKTGPGQRKLVKVVDAGSLADARKRGFVVSALELGLGEGATRGVERMFFFVTLSVELPNRETQESSVQEGFFWLE